MAVIHQVRDLLALDDQAIWNIPDTPKMSVEFDDGVMEVDSRAIIFSYYMWWPMKQFDQVPLLKEHCFVGRIKRSTVLTHMDKCIFDTVKYLVDKADADGVCRSEYVDMEYLGILTRKAITLIYNRMTYNLEEYVTGLSALDLLQVADHPKIKAVNDELHALDLTSKGVLANSELYISNAQDIIADALINDKELAGNRQHELAASEQVSLGQQLQLSGPRGHVSDIDSNIFPYPIMSSYSQGLKKLIQFGTDSRAAAKALIFTQHPLQETEYTNRELQILAATLSNLHVHDDCGSTNLIPWPLTKHNLKVVEGMWFSSVPEGGELSVIRKSNVQDLLGTTVYLRTAMTCQHEDEYGICGKCFGELRWQIPNYTNIGHVSVTELCAKVSQDVLSVKHLDGTAIAQAIKLSSGDREFLRPYDTKQQIGINPKINADNIRLRIPKKGLENLADIFNVSRVDKLAESKVSSMSEVCLEIIDEDGDMDFHHVIVGDGNKRSYFTRGFLKYLKEVSYFVEDDKEVVIDLKDWDIKDPIWQIPRRHASALEFLRDVKSNIKNTQKRRSRKPELSDAEALSTKLIDLSELVANKFNIHITHLATVIRTTMVTDSTENNYSIPKGDRPVELETYRKLISGRSVGPATGYQELVKLYYSAPSYLYKDRPYSHFDELIMPPS